MCETPGQRTDDTIKRDVVDARAVTELCGRGEVSSQATSKGAPEETRDRAERGSAVRGSDQRPSSPKRIPRLDPNRDPIRSKRSDAGLTESSNRSYAGHRHTFATNDIIHIVIRNSQLLLGLIPSLLLIGAGLFGFGKKTVLTAAM